MWIPSLFYSSNNFSRHRSHVVYMTPAHPASHSLCPPTQPHRTILTLVARSCLLGTLSLSLEKRKESEPSVLVGFKCRSWENTPAPWFGPQRSVHRMDSTGSVIHIFLMRLKGGTPCAEDSALEDTGQGDSPF